MDYIRIFLFFVVLCILSFVLERLFFFDTANLPQFPSSLKKSIIFSFCLLRQSSVFATHPNHSFLIRRNVIGNSQNCMSGEVEREDDEGMV